MTLSVCLSLLKSNCAKVRWKVSRIGLSVNTAYGCCGWWPSEIDRQTGSRQSTPCRVDGDGAVYVPLHVDIASAIRRHTSPAWHWPRQRPHAACQSPSTHDGQDYRITIISLQLYNTVFHYCHITPTEFTAPVKSHNRVFPYRVYLDRVSIDRVYLHPQQQLKKTVMG